MYSSDIINVNWRRPIHIETLWASTPEHIPITFSITNTHHGYPYPGYEKQSCFTSPLCKKCKGALSFDFNNIALLEYTSRKLISSLRLFLRMKRGVNVTTFINLYFIVTKEKKGLLSDIHSIYHKPSMTTYF